MKIDLKRELADYRAGRGDFAVVEIPERTYLMIDGHGDPNTSADYAAAVAALYPVAYKLKFASARTLGRDYVVMPLEALWSADDMTAFTTVRDKSRWDWTVMILVPDWIGPDLVAAAIEQVASGKEPPPVLRRLRCETLAEGTCVQTLHVGPYDDEAAALARMHDEVIPDRGFRMTGRHHEIYLSDPRRTAPPRLRTILRQPVAPA